MGTVLNLVLGVVILIVLAWIGIFGGIGSILAHSRDGSALSGFALGTFLGPFGWLATFWVTRGAAVEPAESSFGGVITESALTTTDDLWDD